MKSGLADTLRAAGEPTRLRILNLVRGGKICVCDLQAVLGLPQPTVSRHLAALRRVGLLQDVRLGPRVFYSLAPPSSRAVEALLKLLAEVCPGEPELMADLARLREVVRPRGAKEEGKAP